MKVICALVLLSLACAVSCDVLKIICYGDTENCQSDECCVEYGMGLSTVGWCKKLLAEDEHCEMKPRMSVFKKDVYIFKCPCAEGLKCERKGGILGKLQSKCQAVSEEIFDINE